MQTTDLVLRRKTSLKQVDKTEAERKIIEEQKRI
jgi:hypothetical protein